MKKFLFSIVAAFAAVSSAFAADGTFTGITNNILGLATNLVASDSARVGRGTVCVFVSFTSTNGSSVGPVTFEFGRSLDDTNWTKAEGGLRFTNTLAGVDTNRLIVGEIAMGGAQYLRLNAIESLTTNALYGITGIAAKWYYPRSP